MAEKLQGIVVFEYGVPRRRWRRRYSQGIKHRS